MAAATSSAAAMVGLLVLLVGVFGSVALAAGDAAGRRGRVGAIDVSGDASMQRVGDECSGTEDIAIYQGVTKPLPNGIPTYTVEVINECVAADGNCAIAKIHVRCGWFSSARLVDPRVFRRLGHDDCLLNDGRPLHAGDSVSFVYANSFPYKLSVSSASCLGVP